MTLCLKLPLLIAFVFTDCGDQVKRGLMGRLSDTLEARKQRWPDSEEFFQQERDWVARYQPALTSAASALASATAAHLSM